MIEWNCHPVYYLELEFGGVVPPVAHVADLVELPALVVESMTQLVAHDDADGAVVDAPRVLGIISVSQRYGVVPKHSDLKSARKFKPKLGKDNM